jgi:glycosyltransferase involved in cell wall biosynthesis
MSAADPELSVVVPAYNEAARIVEPLRRVDAYLQARHPASEIVVVDDGSTDDTVVVVRRLAAELATPVQILSLPGNRGKGHAVKSGVLAARGRLMLTTDADLSTPIEEAERLLAAVAEGVPVVIGSRKMPGAAVEVRQPHLREAMGRVFTLLTGMLVVRVSDVTCGFKVFTREAAHAIFGRLTLDDWSYDAEALFLARRLGLEVREVPVRWRDVPGTKVRRGRDAGRALVGLTRILANAARGRYDLPDTDGRLPQRS